jgi:hypothetical protein
MSAINTTYYSQILYPAAEFAIGALASIPASWAFTVLHEHGHAFIAERLYDTKARITYGSLSWRGMAGTTRFDRSKPLQLAKWLGPFYSEGLFCAAGPLAHLTSMLAITILTRLDRHAARAMLYSAMGLVFYSFEHILSGRDYVSLMDTNDYANVLVNGGKVAYGLLTAFTFSNAAFIMGNALGLFQELLDQARNSTNDATCPL